MARKADQDTGPTATADDSFFDLLLNKGTRVPRNTSGAVTTVHIPEEIHAQVADLLKTSEALVLPITDEARYQLLRALYIPAAAAIDHSATVTRSKETVKDAEGNVIKETWVATRVSIGEKRGRTAGSTNGSVPDNTGTPEQVQEAAHESHRGW